MFDAAVSSPRMPCRTTAGEVSGKSSRPTTSLNRDGARHCQIRQLTKIVVVKISGLRKVFGDASRRRRKGRSIGAGSKKPTGRGVKQSRLVSRDWQTPPTRRPGLQAGPPCIAKDWPPHLNVCSRVRKQPCADRLKVQLWRRPARSCCEAKVSYFLEGTLKIGLWSLAHRSISVQEGQPSIMC
jgi:hypothetical protein